MNYAHYAEWIRERVEDLVGFGVPRAEAESIMHYVEIGGIGAETSARKEDQLLLDFKAHGSKALAERYGVTDREIRRRRTIALRNKMRTETARIASA